MTNTLAVTLGKCSLEQPIERSPLTRSPLERSPLPTRESSDNQQQKEERCAPTTPVINILPSTPPTLPKRGGDLQNVQQQQQSPPLISETPISLSRSAPNLTALIAAANKQVSNSNDHAILNGYDRLTLSSAQEVGASIEAAEKNGGPLVGGIRPSRIGSIFDHFLVVGLPPNHPITCTSHDERQRHAPQVLYSYPPDNALPNDMIAQFCFPNDVISRSAQRSSSYSSLNQIAFCNLSHLLNPDHSSVFLLQTTDVVYYGICIVKEEEVNSAPTFMENLSTTPKPETTPDEKRAINRSHFDFIAPRVYCFLTRFPFFQLHFQMLHSILERERMLMLFSMTQTHDPTCNISTMDILNMYYNLNIDNVKDKLQFKVPGQDCKTDFHCPLGSEDRLIGDWSLFTTFESLNLEDIIMIFGWALMERSILFVSKHPGNVSSFIFSFIPLLKPFVWQCCFIPILPDSLLESIDAPFPYLIGISEMPPNILKSKRDYLIVDIDNKKLILPDAIPSPHLPGTKKLKETFKMQNKIPFEHLKNRYVQSIIMTFRDYHGWLVDQISAGVITCINNMYMTSATSPNTTIDAPSSIELLNKQSIHFLEDHLKQIVACLPENYQVFFSAFFHTQMFAVNAVKLMLTIQERHKTNISQIEKLEALIQMEEKSKEVLIEYQRMAARTDNKVNVDIIKQQLRDSEGVINELRESKKKLELEALATSPSKNGTSTLTSFLGLSEIRKKKLEFGHRRSRSVSDQVEKNILKKSARPPALSFFDLAGRSSSAVTTSSPLTGLSKSQSPLSSTNPLLDILEKDELNSSSNNNTLNISTNKGNDSPRNLMLGQQ
eukprot:gene13348-15701_t